MMGKRLVLLLFLLTTALGSLWLFQSVGEERLEWQDPILSIPEGTKEIIRFHHPGMCEEKLKQQSAFRQMINDLDILTDWVNAAKDSIAKTWINDQPLIRAAYGDSSVYVYGLPKNLSQQKVETWLVSHMSAQPLRSGVLSIQGGSELFIYIRPRAAFLSRSNDLQLPNIATENEQNLWSERVHMGSHSDILQIRETDLVTIPFIQVAKKGLMVRDIQLEAQHIGSEEYLVQEAPSFGSATIPVGWTQYLPSDATNIEGLGVHSGSELLEEQRLSLEKTDALATFNDALAEIESSTNTSLEQALSDWWNAGLLAFSSNDHQYALLGNVSTSSAISSLQADTNSELTALNGGSLLSWSDTTVTSFVLKELTGANYRSCWIKDNEVLFASSREALVELVARLRSNDRMDDNHIVYQALNRGEQFIRYTSFEETNLEAVDGIAIPVFNTEDGPFSHLVQSGVHLGNGRWVTRMDISPATRKTVKVALAWQKRLGFKILGKVGSVKNHRTGEYYMVIQDTEFKLHAIDARGKAMWSYKLDGPIQSEFYSIDLYRNDKFQIAFSTANKVYCLDLNGRNVDGFPIAPGRSITMPLYIADYDGTKNYRFLFGLDDGKILNYRDEGQATSGWKYKGKIAAKYGEHIKSGDKDYLFIALEDGRIKLLKRNGTERHKSKVILPPTANSYYFKMASEISRSSILALDSTAVTEFTIGNGSDPEVNILGEAVDFMLADLNNDRQEELVLNTGTEVVAFSSNGQQLFKRIMDGAIQKGLKSYRFNSGERPGVVIEDRNELYLLEGSGNSMGGFPLFGATMPVIRDFDLDGVMELITTDGEGLLLCYEL